MINFKPLPETINSNMINIDLSGIFFIASVIVIIVCLVQMIRLAIRKEFKIAFLVYLIIFLILLLLDLYLIPTSVSYG